MEINRPRNRQEALTPSDEDIVTIVQKLHKPDAYSSTSNVDHFLQPIEDLFDRVTQNIGDHSKEILLASGEGKYALNSLKDNIELISVVESIACQIAIDILNGIDAHNITIWVLECLAKYSWEDKLVLTLTAFGLTFGDFWLLIRIYSNNAINKPMTGDNSTEASGNKEAYRSHIEANNDFIKGLVNSTRYVIEFKELTNTYFPIMSDRFPIYIYWIMRSTIVAATQIIILSSKGLDQYVNDVSEPDDAVKLQRINDELRRNLTDMYKRVGEKEIMKVYKQEQIDNLKLMRCLIYSDNDFYPLYDDATKTKVDLDILRKKYVLLLISGLNISPEDISKLKHVNYDSKTHAIVWIPVVDPTFPGMEEVYENLQKSIPWYSVRQLSMITDAAILFFRNEWRFKSSPILVVLSPQGKVLNKNAIHMVRIWQNLPVENLTSEMESQLWEKETWDLNLLVNDVDSTIQTWIKDEKYTFLYGGVNIEWIRNFLREARSMASALQVELQMVYMGQSHGKHGVRWMKDVITAEQLSHCLPQSTKNFFWSRIGSMIFSKLKLGKSDNDNDTLLREILKFHNLNEWALLAKGSRILLHGPGEIALAALKEIQNWREQGIEPGYVDRFLKHYKSVHHCHTIFLPTTEDVPRHLTCPSCQSKMMNFVFLECGY
ncbi:hypothetical protein vseg_019823 [Gypsophila vaccaria]